MPQAEPYICTTMTTEGGKYFDLLKSARKWGWKLQAHFTPVEDGDEELFSKAYHAYIKRKHLELKKILEKAYLLEGFKRFFYMDGWDTVLTGPPEEIPWLHPLNFSAEKFSYPETRYIDLFPPGSMPSLNAGVIWGEIEAYLARCPRYEIFDQLGWIREYMNNPEGIWLDTESQVAVSLYGIADQDTWGYSGGRTIYRPTGTKPLVLHANGKWFLPAWLTC